jgi:hypothetical protein
MKTFSVACRCSAKGMTDIGSAEEKLIGAREMNM